MRQRLLTVTVLVSAATLALSSVALGEPKSATSAPADDALAKTVAQLKTDGEAFAAAKDDKGPPVNPLVQKLLYTAETLPAVNTALQGKYGQPLVELYVYYQLLQPLKAADNDTLRRLKPQLLNLLNQRCQYKQMPNWSRAQLAELNPPADSKDLMKQMEKVNKARDAKNAAEMPTVKHNVTVAALEKTLKQLLAMMSDQQADDALLQRLTVEEANNSAAYQDTLAALKNEAPRMEQPRAKKLYDRLRTIGNQVGAVKKTYNNYADPAYSVTAVSGWRGQPGYFCIDIANAVNAMATRARETAIQVPDAKTLDAGGARRPGRG